MIQNNTQRLKLKVDLEVDTPVAMKNQVEAVLEVDPIIHKEEQEVLSLADLTSLMEELVVGSPAVEFHLLVASVVEMVEVLLEVSVVEVHLLGASVVEMVVGVQGAEVEEAEVEVATSSILFKIVNGLTSSFVTLI